jgi:predicted DNA-binding WGR domain protein
MEPNRILFNHFLSTAQETGDYSTDDTIAFVLPLFKKVLALHEAGLVGPFEREDAIFVRYRGSLRQEIPEFAPKTDFHQSSAGGYADIDDSMAHAPSDALYRVQALFPRAESGPFDSAARTEHPPYLPGYRCFEHDLGHHDPQSDIFCLGLVLASIAMGLNLYDADDRERFTRLRLHPTQEVPRIHPTLGRLITEMTEPDRNRRSQDLYDAIARLEHYRDYDPEKQTDLSALPGWMDRDLKERDAYILNRLRNRLFDTSRRNRLLYFKPNARFVNLTVGSIPIVLHHSSIRPDHLFTWNPELARHIIGCEEIVLNRYLRFEDHPYLPSSLDKVRVEAQRDIQEYGFSQLKLVIAFLEWRNLKEDPRELIRSPLLLVPVTIRKHRRPREDHYILKVSDNAAEVNPVLAGQLRELHGIRLPDFVDLEEMSPEEFYRVVKSQIEEASQGIVLRWVGKPGIELLQQEAVRTIGKYRAKAPRMRGPGPEDRAVEPDHRAIESSGQPEEAVPPRENAGDASSATAGEAVAAEGTAAELPREAIAAEESAGLSGEEVVAEVALAPADSNPYNWDFDVCNMVLGNFHYKKMSLVRDYNLVIDRRQQHPTFESLFGEHPRLFPEHPFDGNRPDDWFHVVSADPTQTKAILQSRAGYSYIIQGPPGTGKSQTITNLIADFAARGKSILFVCEKRAALDVVFHRLKLVGLEELCCYIHDSQGDKRDFIRNLKATYEDFMQHRMDLPALKERRETLLRRMSRHLGLLREFHDTALHEDKETGITVRALIESIIALREQLPVLDPGEEELLPTYAEWAAAGPVMAGLDAVMEETGAGAVFSEHPFSRINEAVIVSNSPYRTLENAVQEALLSITAVETMLVPCGLEPRQLQEHGRLKNLVQFAVLLLPLARSRTMALADPDSDESKQLEKDFLVYRREQEVLRQATEKNRHWKQKLDEQDLDAALSVTARFEGKFFSRFNSTYRKLKHRLRESYDLAAHAVTPPWSNVLQTLKAEYAAAGTLEQTRQQLRERFALGPNIDTTRLSIELLQNRRGNPELGWLLHHSDGHAVVTALAAAHQPLLRMETAVNRCLQDPPSGALSPVRDLLLNIRLNADALSDWLPALRGFAGLPDRIKTVLRQLPLRIKQAEAAVARKALQQSYQTHREYAGIDGSALETAVRQLGEEYTALQEINAQLIRAFVRQRFLHQVELSGRAGAQLSEEQKKFKKAYAEGRKILENEFGKSMRYKSIRELSEKESGLVLKALKPVWLMSPYSVSDSLPLDEDHFDVVIFDEASQITLEEGVPALYRSQQTIIVGDEKQMPPTDFFGSRTDDPEDLDRIVDPEDEGEQLTIDADSLLAQGARKLESTLLSWHYRSHSETLISFSNHAFYEGELLTIPDKTIHHLGKEPILVAGATGAGVGAAALFDRSISFHLLTGGVYEKRTNPGEAAYIAHLVRELLRNRTPESIGIVAFSLEQEHAIEDALESLAREDPDFAPLLEEAYNRTENDQFTGLIVKNLENIQGDERDIILISVCYGPDRRGRMVMNFGPVNKKGGEKRLNVLFSRAKKHMAVVSSIRFEQITNEYNAGANYLRRFLQYAEHVSGGRMTAARSILDGLIDRQSSDGRMVSPTLVRQQLKEELLARGYEVDGPIGQSDFKCSLAVKKKGEEEEYALGLLIDDDDHYRNENRIEQYYLRPAALRSFGWRVLPVYAKDWLHQPQKVMEQILRILGHANDTPEAALPQGDAGGLGGSFGLAGGVVGLRKDAPGAGDWNHLSFRRWVHPADAVFWEAAVDDSRLMLRWGRKGARGQTRIQTHADAESAIRELAKLEKEQQEKGYVRDQDPR